MHAAGPKSKKMNAAPVRKSHVKKGKGARCHAKTITMASACTGWGSDVLAAEMLKLPAQHAFGVEKDPVVREIALAMHEYTAFYNDVFDKHFFKEKSTDFFFCGFPCPPFSGQGTGLGTLHKDGMVIAPIIKWIMEKKPRTFLLENVRGLVDRHCATFCEIVDILAGIKNRGSQPTYDVSWRILNTRLHGGLPQNRERVFVAGVRRDCQVCPMKWPSEIPMTPLELLIDGGSKPEGSLQWPGRLPSGDGCKARTLWMLNKIWESGGDPLKETWVLNVDNATPHYSYGYSPCITRARGSSSGHWLSWKQRKLRLHEMAKLSGVSPARIPVGFSDKRVGEIIGNSVPVTLLARVMSPLLAAAGLS